MISHTLILVKGTHPGNRMCDPNYTSYNEYTFYTENETLDSFCRKIIIQLKKLFNEATNFQEEIETISTQLKSENFAQLRFNKISSTYNVTIVAPKFEYNQ